MRGLGLALFFGLLGACNPDADRDGVSARDGDCDDDDPARAPSRTDVVGDGIDQNCDGVDGTDADGDGFASTQSGGDDCDDAAASINPSATEIWYDGVDSDCAGDDDDDQDADGFAAEAAGGLDCDDLDANINPLTPDPVGDGSDTNCDGIDGTDLDLDGVPSVASGGADCDDEDPATYPGAPEVDWDGIDQDCDGRDEGVYDQVMVNNDSTCLLAPSGQVECWGAPEVVLSTPSEPLQGLLRTTSNTCASGFTDTGGLLFWGSCGSLFTTYDFVGPFESASVGAVSSTAMVVAVRPGGVATVVYSTDPDSEGVDFASDAIEAIAISESPRKVCSLSSLGVISCVDPTTLACGGGSICSVPAGTFEAMSAGRSSACALGTDGSIACWGDGAGALTPPLGTFRSVSMTPTATPPGACAVRTSGDIVCWGVGADELEVDVPTDGPYDYVEVGNVHACAQAVDGHVDCWGRDLNGRVSLP